MGVLVRACGGTVILLPFFVFGCTLEKAALGEQCRRSDDCASTYCIVERCATAPSPIDPSLLPPPQYVDSGAGVDASTD